MNLSNIKQDLAQKLLETEDEEILNYIQAILDTHPTKEGWFEKLPTEVKADVLEGLKESERGEGIPHDEVMKNYKKWEKR